MRNHNTLPTVGSLNKFFLNQLNIWSSTQALSGIELAPNQKEKKAALKKVIDSLSSQPFNLDDLLAVATVKAPKAKEKTVKSKTIQKHVQALSKSELEDSTLFEEFQPYIKQLLNAALDDDELSQLVDNLWLDTIEQYKLFLRNHPYVSSTEDMMMLFVVGYLIPLVIETITTENLINNFSQKVPLNCFITSFSIDGSNVAKWPIQSFIDYILKLVGISAWELQCFHAFKLNNSNLSNAKAWELFEALDKKPEPSTKVKQLFNRIGKVNKVKWRDVWTVLSPVLVKLNQFSEKELKANLFTAYVIHSISQLCSEHMDVETFKEVNCKAESLAKLCSKEINVLESYAANFGNRVRKSHFIRNYFPTKRDELISIGLADKTCIDNLDWKKLSVVKNSSFYQGEVLALTQQILSEMGDGEAELDKIINSKHFREMLLPNSHVTFEDCQKLEFLIHKHMKVNAGSVWLLNWFYAKRSILFGELNEAGKFFREAFYDGCYRAGPYMYALIVDISAFCKVQFQRVPDKYDDKFYNDFGSSVYKWAPFIGYTPRYVNCPETLMPKSSNPLATQKLREAVNRRLDEIQSIVEQPPLAITYSLN
jgi:hypothetical protein